MLFRLQTVLKSNCFEPCTAPANALETTTSVLKTVQKWHTTPSAPNSIPNLANFSHSQKRHHRVKAKIQTPASFKTIFLKCVQVPSFKFYCNRQSSRPRKKCKNTCFINFNKTRFFAIFRSVYFFMSVSTKPLNYTFKNYPRRVEVPNPQQLLKYKS